MTTATYDKVLTEAFGPTEGTAKIVKQAVLVVAGILALAFMANIKVPMWPVPITMGTFAVLTIGAAYGPRLGLATILGYMIIGALGFDVFATSGGTAFGIEAGLLAMGIDLFPNAENATSGLTYMMGGTGGYLVGYVLATLALGWAARQGWDRSILWMAVAMLIGNALIYIPGLLWLGQLYGWENPILAWGLTPFLVGDALKLALAALLVPGLWKAIGNARA
ncbi:MAG: biotin transporter BioY [Pseudomonadota bacterium]